MVTPVPYRCGNCGSVCSPAQVPGPSGRDGVDGGAGADGSNAFTTITAAFTVPATGATVVVEVVDSTWIVASYNAGIPGEVDGQVIVVEFGGSFLAVDVPDSTHVEIYNLGYPNNAVAGTVIPSGAKVSPGGLQGDPGTIPGGALLASNNLADVMSPATSRGSLGLGALAVKGTVDDGDWTPGGSPLAVANGGTGSTSAAAARTALGLGSIATQAANAVAITGGAISGITDLAVADGGTGASTAAAARTNLGVLGRFGCLGSALLVDMNSVLDQAITMVSTKYVISAIVVTDASVNLTAAAGGVYNGVGKPGGGILVAAGQVYTALSAATKFLALTLAGVALTNVQTAGFIYVSLTTPQGVAATASVYVFGYDLS